MDPDRTASLIETLTASLLNSRRERGTMMPNPMEPHLFSSTSQAPLGPLLPDALQLSELFDSPLPMDAFEPVPIGRNTRGDMPRPTLNNVSLLESILDRTLEAVQQPYSVTNTSEASYPRNFLYHPADQFQPGPVAACNSFVPSPTTSAGAPLRTGDVTGEPESPSNVRKCLSQFTANDQVPKRRRLTDHDDGQPSIHRYQEVQWMAQFQELVKFRDEYGHCLVPHEYQENQVLSRWVKRQRYQYKLKMAGKTSTMTDARIEKLENVGFVWDSHASGWEKRLQELKQYRDEHGNCNVPSSYPKNPALATWIKCQRRQYKLYWGGNKPSSMTPERMEVLDQLGFLWDVREFPFPYPTATPSEHPSSPFEETRYNTFG